MGGVRVRVRVRDRDRVRARGGGTWKRSVGQMVSMFIIVAFALAHASMPTTADAPKYAPPSTKARAASSRECSLLRALKR